MDVMINSAYYRSWICKLMSSEWIFVPSSLKTIQLIIEVIVVDVDFMGTDSNDGT